MAKRHPTSTRTPSDDRGADADDVFVAKVVEYSTWARRNTQTLILAGLALVVIVAGVVYYSSFRQERDLQAIRQLEQIHATVNFGDPETAKAELSQFIESFGGTAYATEARLLLAELHLRSDQPQMALRTLEEADVSLREPLGAEILHLEAQAQEAAGDHQSAVATLLEVADDARLEFQRIEALSDAARIQQQTGDAAGAADLYGRILDLLEETDPRRGVFEMRRAEAQAIARVGAQG